MVIIDAHAHAYQTDSVNQIASVLDHLDSILPKEDPHKWCLKNEGTLDALLRDEKAAGIGRFVLLPVSSSAKRTTELNRWVAEVSRKNPEIIPFASLIPGSRKLETELERLLALGIQGVKIHTILQRYHILNRDTLRMLALLQEARLPVVLDTLHAQGVIKAKPHLASSFGNLLDFSIDPEKTARVARTYPRLKIIAAHLGCLYGWEHLEPLYALDNVYFDLAYLPGILPSSEAVKIIRRKGTHRIIFGSDMPWRPVGEALAWFLKMDFDESDQRQILGENFLELLSR